MTSYNETLLRTHELVSFTYHIPDANVPLRPGNARRRSVATLWFSGKKTRTRDGAADGRRARTAVDPIARPPSYVTGLSVKLVFVHPTTYMVYPIIACSVPPQLTRVLARPSRRGVLLLPRRAVGQSQAPASADGQSAHCVCETTR